MGNPLVGKFNLLKQAQNCKGSNLKNILKSCFEEG